MSLSAPHCRIGRVRMKAGGAEVRVIPQSGADNGTRTRIRAWMAEVMDKRPPDAVVMVAWWAEGDGCPVHATSAATYHDAFPLKVLPDMAAAEVRTHLQLWWAESRVMRVLGYVPGGTDPDDAA